MRWIVASLVTLLLAWGFYTASPYYTLYRLGRAVEAGQTDEVERRINVRALRLSLARQIAAEFAATERGGIASGDAQMAAGAALALADPFIEHLMQPAGLIQMLSVSPSGDPGGSAFGRSSTGVEDIDDFLFSSTWRGFRNVYVALPPGEPKETRFRLQLRLSHWQWRVVAIDLPPALVRRITLDLKSRLRR